MVRLHKSHANKNKTNPSLFNELQKNLHSLSQSSFHFFLQDSITMNGVREKRTMNGVREKRAEFRRLSVRFLVAVMLDIFRMYCEQQAYSDSNPETKTGGSVSLYCASELNKLANACFLMVIIKIALVPMQVERMRRLQEESDVKLVIGSICLMFSLSFLVYLRWFVIGWLSVSLYSSSESSSAFSVQRCRLVRSSDGYNFFFVCLFIWLVWVCFFDLNMVCW